MCKKKKKMDRFVDLTWNDLEGWAGSKIVSRGKNYQRQGRVHDLAVTGDNGLIAWVDGTQRYATKVIMDDDGLPDSICTCPYELDCKHGVAVVIEYLKRVEGNHPVPRAEEGDARLHLVEDDDWHVEVDDEKEAVSGDVREKIDSFLKGQTKSQLIELIHEIARQHPEVAQAMVDRWQLISGKTKTIVTRLRREIQEIGAEPGWQDYWRGSGYTPDYSGIRKKMETLLKTGYPDEVLALGRELVSTCMRQVREGDDEGETAMEVADCMPVIVNALDQSSLDPADKLNWALNVLLEDEYDLCEAFAEYLHRKHPKSAWHNVADRLLQRLKGPKHSKDPDDFHCYYERDQLSDWAICALEQSGRKDEIIPLCEAEAERTKSYERLVRLLVSEGRYDEAVSWIRKGIQETKQEWPGIAGRLRDSFREIRMGQKNWAAVAAMQVEEFVRHPSRQAFEDSKKAAVKIKAWPKVRECLLQYLEKGDPPWMQKDWPLPASGLEVPKRERRDGFPKVTNLMEIAVLEKDPERILYWYDRLSEERFGWSGVNDDEIATAVQIYALERAVAIWKTMAEQLIAQVKPKAYRTAGKYLRKAAKAMAKENKGKEWERYLQGLRKRHARKTRLMEVLDGLDDKSA